MQIMPCISVREHIKSFITYQMEEFSSTKVNYMKTTGICFYIDLLVDR